MFVASPSLASVWSILFDRQYIRKELVILMAGVVDDGGVLNHSRAYISVFYRSCSLKSLVRISR